MAVNKKVFIAAIVLMLSVIFPLCVNAQTSAGMVVKKEGGLIIINKGLSDGLKEGQELYIKRINMPIAKIKIAKIEDYYCGATEVSVEKDQEIKIGDQATLEQPPKIAAQTVQNKTAEEFPKQSSSSAKAAPDAKSLQKAAEEKEKAEQAKKDEISKDYVSTLGKFTKEVTFSTRTGTTILPSPSNIASGLGLYSVLRHTTGYTYRDPFLLLSLIKGTVKDHQAPQRSTHMDAKVTIGLIYYSNELINSQAKFFASKDNTEDDPVQVKAIADGIKNQLGTDLYTVFQAKIENRSETAMQFAPFKWKMSIITDDGQQIKAIKYDDSLDKTIGPGQSAQGYMYFPQTDAMGNKLTDLKLKVKLESILNKKTEIKW